MAEFQTSFLINLTTSSGVSYEKEFPEGDHLKPSRVFSHPWRLLIFQLPTKRNGKELIGGSLRLQTKVEAKEEVAYSSTLIRQSFC